jgi:hypothetical protein
MSLMEHVYQCKPAWRWHYWESIVLPSLMKHVYPMYIEIDCIRQSSEVLLRY